MQIAVTVVAAPDRADALDAAARAVGQAVTVAGARVKEPRRLWALALDWLAEGEDLAAIRAAAQAAVADHPCDVCVQPWSGPGAGRAKRLLVADMDSTIIGCEGLDELADYAGVKDRVAPITEAAMRGELDFAAALRARVAMLEGLPEAALDRCYRERVRLNPGAEALVRGMGAAGARCVLVSGGFSVFAERVAAEAGFHAVRANVLEVADGRLTGRVAEPILGREAKLAALREEATALGVGLEAAVAMGDGANDLAMIEAADAAGGLGVAYRAKPVVAARASTRLEHADLSAVLAFQGLG